MPFDIPRPPQDSSNFDEDRLVLLPEKFRHEDILFITRRTCNDNLCVYSVNRNQEDGTIDPNNPIDVYWVDHLHKENKWKECSLNALEARMAYGVRKVHGVEPHKVKFSIQALPELRIIAEINPDEPQAQAFATTKLQHKRCRIHSVDVQMGTPSLLNLNPVKWIRINGYQINTGELCSERISN
jgi:hypothetical protein